MSTLQQVSGGVTPVNFAAGVRRCVACQLCSRCQKVCCVSTLQQVSGGVMRVNLAAGVRWCDACQPSSRCQAALRRINFAAGI